MSRIASAHDTPAYTLAAAGDTVGKVLSRYPGDVVTDPRKLWIGDLAEEITPQEFAARHMVAGEAPVALVRVTPLADVDTDDNKPSQYRLDEVAGFDGFFGPQAPQIRAAVGQAEKHLHGNPDTSDQAKAYYTDADAAHDEMDAAETAAAGAMDAAGIDAGWWTYRAFGCTYGREIVALAARDLVGTTEEWSWDAYAAVTAPWRAAFGHIHPDDASRPEMCAQPVVDAAPAETTSPQVCDNTSVAVLIRDELGRLLMFERATFPAGVACAAGHVDDHGTPQDAAIAETNEELGLHVDADSLWLVTGGWRPNRCRRQPGPRGIGHMWSVFEATATGDLAPSQRETRGARWLYPGQVQELASRTALYAHGRITDDEFAADPGIEPVQVQWLVDASVIDMSPEDLALIDELAHRGGTAGDAR